jgi:hypothetical protein
MPILDAALGFDAYCATPFMWIDLQAELLQNI